MKRFLAVLLTAVILMAGSAANAQTFSSLAMLQQFLMKHSPESISATGTHYAELSGVILDIRYTGQSNHYELTLQVDDQQALVPLEYDSSILIVHFRLHVDPIPFQLGEEITVFGEISPLYSSVMIPMILAKTINGTEDF